MLKSRLSPTSRTTRSSPDATSGVKSLRARSALTLTRSIERKCTEGSASTLSNSSTAHYKDNRRQYSCRNLTGSNRRDSRVGRIISVHEYDLKPGINISRTHSQDTEARGLLQRPGLVAHHARTSYFIVVTCVLRFGLETGGVSAGPPHPQNRLAAGHPIRRGPHRVFRRRAN